MSNSTSTPLTFETPVPTPTPSTSPPANTPSPSPVPTTEPTTEPTTFTPPTTVSTSSFVPPTTSSSQSPPTTSSTTSTAITPTTSSTTSTRAPSTITSIIIQTPTDPGQPPSTIVITSTETFSNSAPTSRSSSSGSSTLSSTAGLTSQTGAAAPGGLNGGGKIAVAVVVPIVAVALLILGGIFFWRKRKQRKDAEELRRKEVEEYGYNPNNDPSLPVGAAAAGGTADSAYEMKEDGSSGYRGWGTTAVASTGRKASTTMSGPSATGNNNTIGMAYSDPSPSHDARSDNPLVDGRSLSPEPETLGAMGPAASQNRNGDIHRGPSNASSSYSAANRSDGSGDVGGFGGHYNNQYDTGNPYTDTTYGSPPNRAEMSGQPVIRDVSARRNTRIENPSHFPQQSAGISQNF